MKKKHIENSDSFKHLQVNDGVEHTQSINPKSIEKFRSIKQPRVSADDFYKGIIDGHIPTLSRAITLIESSNIKHLELANAIITKCIPKSGKSKRIGITGVPGVGKSTFIEALGLKLVKEGHKVAILTIDPSSEKNKGSILGDKTRMEELVKSDLAFIRPSPSSGSLGGVARKTRESIILCEAAGFDVILIETVGVGQSETAVHSMTDFFLLLMLAGAGDELQGIKKGIMEMADTIAITKADGDNKIKAIAAESEYKNALHLFSTNNHFWQTQVLSCSAETFFGIDKVWNHIESFYEKAIENNFINEKRLNQSKYWMHQTIKEKILNHLYNSKESQEFINEKEHAIINNEISPFKAAEEVFIKYLEQMKKPLN